MRTWRLLLIGFGNVGQGVAARLRDADAQLRSLGCDARIVGVLDPVHGNVAAADGLDPAALLDCIGAGNPLQGLPGAVDVPDPTAAIGSIEADVVFEMTPTDLRTGGAGLLHVRAALQAGRHVVTSNKGPIALAYRELHELAEQQGVQLRCEGTVMSGTPVLNLCDAGLRGAQITGLRGVLNGTCNFVISQIEAGSTMPEAVSEAQRLGYAETDPTGDLDGWDAAAKVAILANLVLDVPLRLEHVRRRGITDLSAQEIRDAVTSQQRWRLVGSLSPAESGWSAAVRPRLLPALDPLALACGPENVLELQTRALGTVTISGPGAGREATGHALLADLLAIHRSCA